MKTTIRRNVRHALAVRPRDLGALWKLLQAKYEKVEVTARCRDGSALETSDLSELTQFDNPGFRRLKSIELTVFSAGNEDVSNEKPGTPCVHLVPGSRVVRVLDADKRERGIIRSEGLMPPGRFVMRLSTEVLWVLSVRSVVRKRHTLCPAAGGQWTFDTPFFWRQQLSGSVGGTPRLLGTVGPTKRLWFMMIEAGRDTPEVLAAVAFMHRKWWRW